MKEFDEVLEINDEKLIRRNPHVFGGGDITVEEVIEKWEQIKKQEKGHGGRNSILDGIPKNLHALARAQKVLGKIKGENPAILGIHPKRTLPLSETAVGEELVQAVLDASEAGIDIEGALRRAVGYYEEVFRSWEGKGESS